MGIDLLVLLVDDIELSWQVHSLGVGNFGEAPCCVVAEPGPVVESAADAELETVVFDFHF